MKKKLSLKIAFVGATLGLSNLAVGAMPAYSITALATPAGFPICGASAINNFAQVVGYCSTADYSATHAFRWSAGHVTDLGVLPGQVASWASAINDNGQIVGVSGNQVFIWSNGTMKALRLPKGYTGNCMPNSINISGQVAGTCSNPSANVWHAFRWTHGNVTDLGSLPGDISSYANGINNAGQIVGSGTYISDAANSTVEHHATLWNNGTLSDLGTIGINLLPGYNSSYANAINNKGQVVGRSNVTTLDSTGAIADISEHAFLWQSGSMVDLGALPGSNISVASAINDNGQVVGTSPLTNSAGVWIQGAFLYDYSNGMVALDTLLPSNSGWTLYSVSGINNQGQIVATGYNTDQFTTYTLLLTPQK